MPSFEGRDGDGGTDEQLPPRQENYPAMVGPGTDDRLRWDYCVAIARSHVASNPDDPVEVSGHASIIFQMDIPTDPVPDSRDHGEPGPG